MPPSAPAAAETSLEARVTQVGRELAASLEAVLEAVPDAPHRPQALARQLGIDKVLSSRLLKALRSRDGIAVVHLSPGPDPLRRVVRSAAKQGVPADAIAAAESTIDDFEQLIRRDAGDRSALSAMITAWLPEARREFELRRKQEAFKAMSHLKGVSADVDLATVVLHPADDNTIDVVWVFGLLGLRRLRPGSCAKFASRKLEASPDRRPVTLDGTPVESLDGLRLDAYCSSPPPVVQVTAAGSAVHYILAGEDFGPGTGVDLVFAEANFGEISRHVEPGRLTHVFAEVSTPARQLLFDVAVHQDLFVGAAPKLAIYDTSFDGIASPNDRGRDIDRYDLAETIQGPINLRQARTRHVPRYVDLMREVSDRLSWDPAEFRGYRCEIEYPIYGSQVTVAF